MAKMGDRHIAQGDILLTLACLSNTPGFILIISTVLEHLCGKDMYICLLGILMEHLALFNAGSMVYLTRHVVAYTGLRYGTRPESETRESSDL